MKKFLMFLIISLFPRIAFADNSVIGFWTTIDDATNEEKSVVRIYEYQGALFGRVVDLLKNKEATAKIKNSPKIKGLDIIWDLKQDDGKFTGGKILDPQTGKVYGCEIWRENDTLIVRGKIAFLGRNQTWLKNTTYQPTDKAPLIPQRPEID